MNTAMVNAISRMASVTVEDRLVRRPNGLPGYDIPASGMNGWVPPLRRFPAAGSIESARGRGLDQIEAKRAARLSRAGTMIGKADSLVTLCVGVPFAALFVLGVLTLA